MFYGGGKDIRERCLNLAVKIIKMTKNFPKDSAGFELSKQIIRSSGSIGANLSEANCARTQKEFISCVTISLKEAEETKWWLTLIDKSGIILKDDCEKLLEECSEIIKILVTIIKNTKD